MQWIGLGERRPFLTAHIGHQGMLARALSLSLTLGLLRPFTGFLSHSRVRTAIGEHEVPLAGGPVAMHTKVMVQDVPKTLIATVPVWVVKPVHSTIVIWCDRGSMVL
ncbi:hypothetical protein A5892_04495 [Halotalea alkalilenta]|uniref:Uncharacterized protein n=2 Tax=Halotalea alkalilenta TaxID=376489 RepID=A0A172YC68_9GAMM|nr:hypothetical protein A5892_04495 [Halotalea alkalilenta]